MDLRLIDRRLRKLEAELPAEAPDPEPGEEGLRQVEARLRSGEASAADFRRWFETYGDDYRRSALECAQRWEEGGETDEAGRRLGLIGRHIAEIIVTPPDQPTPARAADYLLSWARFPREHRGGLGRDFWVGATLALMAMGGPDGLPLRREFAARRAGQVEDGR